MLRLQCFFTLQPGTRVGCCDFTPAVERIHKHRLSMRRKKAHLFAGAGLHKVVRQPLMVVGLKDLGSLTMRNSAQLQISFGWTLVSFRFFNDKPKLVLNTRSCIALRNHRNYNCDLKYFFEAEVRGLNLQNARNAVLNA